MRVFGYFGAAAILFAVITYLVSLQHKAYFHPIGTPDRRRMYFLKYLKSFLMY